MSKIWVEVYAKVECSTKDELKDDMHKRPQVEVHTNSSKSRPSIEKKTTFCRNFLFEDLELSIFCHIFALRKDIRQAHSHIHDIHPHKQSSVFRDDEIFIKQRASSK